jgi:hypothetical protein
LATSLLFCSDAAAETLGETVDTATGINDFLLARVERVAFAAHVYVEIFTQRGAGFETVTATAINSHFNVIWMNICFHDLCLDVICAATRTLAEHRTTVKKKTANFGSGDTIRLSRQGKQNIASGFPPSPDSWIRDP